MWNVAWKEIFIHEQCRSTSQILFIAIFESSDIGFYQTTLRYNPEDSHLSFLLSNTQEKLHWFSLYQVIRQGECFVPLVMVTLTKKEKTVLGTSYQHTELNADEKKFRSFYRMS
jgi:hypothetical protein